MQQEQFEELHKLIHQSGNLNIDLSEISQTIIDNCIDFISVLSYEQMVIVFNISGDILYIYSFNSYYLSINRRKFN